MMLGKRFTISAVHLAFKTELPQWLKPMWSVTVSHWRKKKLNRLVTTGSEKILPYMGWKNNRQTTWPSVHTRESLLQKNLSTVSHFTDGLILSERQNESQSGQQKTSLWVFISFFYLRSSCPPAQARFLSAWASRAGKYIWIGRERKNELK